MFDHDVASEVASVLRARGHDVVELRNVLAPDTPDPDVWAYAGERQPIAETGPCQLRYERSEFQNKLLDAEAVGLASYRPNVSTQSPAPR